MSDDWQPGDLALCVNDRPSPFWGFCIVQRGRLYTVAGLDKIRPNPVVGRCVCLFLEGLRPHQGSDGPVGVSSNRFYKIRPHTPDAEDAETIRLLTGKPVREPAA